MRELIERKKEEIIQKEIEKGVKRVFSDNPYELVKKLIHQYKMFSRITSKYVSANRKLKIIDSKVQKELVSNEEALRHLLEEELKEKFGRKKLVFYKTEFIEANSLYFPYLARVGFHKTQDLFFKIDIEKCFYSIYSEWGLDVICSSKIDHERKIISLNYIGLGEFNKKNSEIISRLEGEKILRNTVYGLTRSAWQLRIYQDGRVERGYFRGKLQNLDLTVLISSILHYIVGQLINYLVYWNIDGGIIHSSGLSLAEELIQSFGLRLRKEVASDEAIVLGIGRYKVGDYETIPFKNTRELKKEDLGKEIKNLYVIKNIEEVLRWLKKR
ncbi:MAG: hypothetical protein ACP5HT_07560 [Conexivisphaera sp.]|uniref:hypothetical protein n=1 Tax=Caldisphaera sp. TaxID=2060322 RepID=UPI003D0BA0E8